MSSSEIIMFGMSPLTYIAQIAASRSPIIVCQSRTTVPAWPPTTARSSSIICSMKISSLTPSTPLGLVCVRFISAVGSMMGDISFIRARSTFIVFRENAPYSLSGISCVRSAALMTTVSCCLDSSVLRYFSAVGSFSFAWFAAPATFSSAAFLVGLVRKRLALALIVRCAPIASSFVLRLRFFAPPLELFWLIISAIGVSSSGSESESAANTRSTMSIGSVLGASLGLVVPLVFFFVLVMVTRVSDSRGVLRDSALCRKEIDCTLYRSVSCLSHDRMLGRVSTSKVKKLLRFSLCVLALEDLREYQVNALRA